MSVGDFRMAVPDAAKAVLGRYPPVRLLALGGVIAVVGGFLSVLYRITVITGNPTTLYSVVLGAAVAGTLAARVVRPRTAGFVAFAAAICGTYLYVQSLPGGVAFLGLVAPMLDDAAALLSGLSVLRIVNADVWALSAAPAPVFLACYFALRRQYVAASAVGGAALGLLVLTGDATVVETAIGAVGVAAAAAFGDCDLRGERLRNADGVVVVIAAMLVLTLFVGVVPGSLGGLLSAEGFGGSETTMESSLVHAGDSLAIAGSVDLSSDRRYTVEADEEAYWRVGTYDRYTGGGWVRSGSTSGYDGPLAGPPGESRTVEQTYTTQSTIATLPAAREPTRIDGVPVPVQVTEGGSFEPSSTLQAGESYSVESEVPVATPGELRDAGTSYPDGVSERYTQLPDDTPDRVAERTDRLTANAENPYDTARVLEQWFQTEYDYSLDVDRPRGDIADAFLFEMDAGYCTYFATTMVTMLRTQDIPARFAVGYTPGEQVDDDEWVVRGYNSHAWVEVYVPDHGWIEFDPTPSEPRVAAEQQAFDDSAPENGDDGAEAEGDDSATPEATDDETEAGADDGGDLGPDPVAAGEASAEEGERWVSLIPTPSAGQVGGGIAVVALLAVLARRRGLGRRAYRWIWLRRLPNGDPNEVVVGAYRRAVYLEERTGRRKAPGETPRQFFAGRGDRLERISEQYERARYGGGVDEAAATQVRTDLVELRSERSSLSKRSGKPARGSR